MSLFWFIIKNIAVNNGRGAVIANIIYEKYVEVIVPKDSEIGYRDMNSKVNSILLPGYLERCT